MATASHNYDVAKKKTTLMIDDGLYAEIRERAAKRGESTSSIVAEALSRYVADCGKGTRPRIRLTQAVGEWTGPKGITTMAQWHEILDDGVPLEKLR